MAEIAGGALVAEQVISTTVEGGLLAGYAVSEPTIPLKATFQQIDSKIFGDHACELERSHHSLSIGSDGRAYIFGGELAPGNVCSNDMCVIKLPAKDEEAQCSRIPAGSPEEEVPCPRTKHSMCVQGQELAMFGGLDGKDHVVDQDSCVWVWNVETCKWRKITTSSHASQNAGTPQSRFDHKIFSHSGHLILHGGQSVEGNLLNDTWFLDLTSDTWSKLPDAPVHSDSVTFANGTLYAISQQPSESFCCIHTLEIGSQVPATDPATLLTSLAWQAASSSAEDIPPHARIGAGFVPITTGYGRQYLTYLFGSSPENENTPSTSTTTTGPENSEQNPEPAFYSDFWTYQITSKSTKPASWTDLKPAAIKDGIRNAFGKSSGENEWAEVEVQAPEQEAHAGKVHPGPRAFIGMDVTADGKGIVLWGGVNAKGEKEGDGWLISFE